MKKASLLLLLTSFITTAVAQNNICHITGTTTDSLTTKIFLIENGKDPYNQNYINVIPVEDGKFNYDLKCDTLRYYDLIPLNQFREGRFRPANIIAEEQTVDVKFGTIDDIPEVNGNGIETRKIEDLERIKKEYRETTFARYEAQRDSVINIALAQAEGLDENAKMEYLRKTFDEQADNDLAKSYYGINNNYRMAAQKQQIVITKWLTENPCFYGLAWLNNIMSGQINHLFGELRASIIGCYNTTYRKLYKGHPYCANIDKAIASLDLKVGNKYIDYDVTDVNNNKTKISSLYTGKVIYIDLWASWCGSCRRRSKELIPIYEKYKDKGFQVIGIARENSIKNMENAIAKDGYPWLCLPEINDCGNIWLMNGAQNAGGGGFLIDADGTILAVYPSAEETEKILIEKL